MFVCMYVCMCVCIYSFLCYASSRGFDPRFTTHILGIRINSIDLSPRTILGCHGNV